MIFLLWLLVLIMVFAFVVAVVIAWRDRAHHALAISVGLLAFALYIFIPLTDKAFS